MTEKIDSRIVSSMPIAKSFKGILRIGHVLDILSEKPDIFLETTYYGNPIELLDISGSQSDFSPCGTNHPAPALNGEVERYSTDNAYTNVKLPVCDSVGNYINMNVGYDSISFGCNFQNNSLDLDTIELEGKDEKQNKFYPIINNDTLNVGYDALGDMTTSPSVNIDDYDKIRASLIIENLGDQEREKSDGTPTNLKTKEDKKYRTVYQNSNTQYDYGVFLYHQENYNRNNIKNSSIDSVVEPSDLKKYVSDRVKKLLKTEIVEVPTGTITWQYCSLEKWKGNEKGNRPAMGNDSQTEQFSQTKIYGAVKKDINYLRNKNTQYDENIPLYKRDYVLCDGSQYVIPLRQYTNGTYSSTELFERFFDLFFCIGYNFTDTSDVKIHNDYTIKDIVIDVSNGEEIYGKRAMLNASTSMSSDSEVFRNSEDFKSVSHGIDICTILAYRRLVNSGGGFTDSSGKYSRKLAEDYLRKQKMFGDDVSTLYSFPTPIPSSGLTKQNMLFEEDDVAMIKGYKYGEDDPESTKNDIFFGMELGREVSCFEDWIRIYPPADGDKNKIYMCRVWQLPSIQKLLDIYGEILNSSSFDYYKYTFNVPNFDVKSESGKDTIGGFMGSSINFDSRLTRASSGSSYNSIDLPHRHFLYYGSAEFSGGLPADYDSYSSSPDDRAKIQDSKRYIPAADHLSVPNAESPSARWKWDGNYCVFELNRNNARSENGICTVNSIGDYGDVGILGNGDFINMDDYDSKIFLHNCEPNRFPTSTPVETTYTEGISAKFDLITQQTGTSCNFFLGESIVMLPLIKL